MRLKLERLEPTKRLIVSHFCCEPYTTRKGKGASYRGSQNIIHYTLWGDLQSMNVDLKHTVKMHDNYSRQTVLVGQFYGKENLLKITLWYSTNEIPQCNNNCRNS